MLKGLIGIKQGKTPPVTLKKNELRGDYLLIFYIRSCIMNMLIIWILAYFRYAMRCGDHNGQEEIGRKERTDPAP